jgi:citrate lyase subunit beta / citryl-CoA lyase
MPPWCLNWLWRAIPDARVAVRVHPVDHPAFEPDVATIVGRAGQRLCHLMVPKVESVQDVITAVRAIDEASWRHRPARCMC